MKIVIVLCSLATFAIAVPVYQENYIESSFSNQPLRTKRVRKSTLPDFIPGSSPEHGIERIPNNKKINKETSVEVKSFRKPIIIKRRLGYHVYRDSDEELAHAEPGEKCREQVKFKLCDHEPVLSSKNGIKSPTFKCMNNYKTSDNDNEMESSIKMAKDAVEQLQRDLKRMEIFSPKMRNPHVEDIESNTGLQHDIEIAREALEHIEQNFESVNLEVKKVNDLQKSKPQDEERLTRWREAIENLHKNFEIVRNIEDAFKSDNQYSLVLSNSRKASESEISEYPEGHINVDRKFTNDNLESDDEVYNKDIKLKSASKEDEIAELTPQTEYVLSIGREAGNDMFISPTANREENMQLHSDSLKSDIHSKDTSLRSDVSEDISTKYETIPKESIDTSRENPNYLSEVPRYSEHERTINDDIGDDHKLLAKVSSSSYENVKTEEQKGIAKFQLTMKTAFPDREDRHPIIKMKSVEEILKKKKDQTKAATSNEENINKYEEMFSKSEKEHNPLQKLSSIPKSTITEAFENLGDGDEKENDLNKFNNKNIEDKERQFKTFNTNERISNYQLQQEINDGAQDFKNVHDSKYEYKNIKSSEVQGGQPDSRNIEIDHQNSHPGEAVVRSSESDDPKIPFVEYQEGHESLPVNLNVEHHHAEDRTWQFSKSVPEQHSDAMVLRPTERLDTTDDQLEQAKLRSSDKQNENLQLNEYQEGPMQSSMNLGEENNSEDTKSQFLKSVPELTSDPMVSMPTGRTDSAYDQHPLKEEASSRSSESQNEPLQLIENQEKSDHSSVTSEVKNIYEEPKFEFSKSVSELSSDPIASLPTDVIEINNDHYSVKEVASVRSSENHDEKIQSGEYQERHESVPTTLNLERSPEDLTWQISKSVLELPSDPMVSVATDRVDMTDDQHSHKEEASMKSSENQNEKLQFNEYKKGPEHWLMRLDKEINFEDPKSQFSKSVPELPSDVILSIPQDKVDIIEDQHSNKQEATMRSSGTQNEKFQLKEYQEGLEYPSMRLDEENNIKDSKSDFSKSVPELQSDPIVSLPTDKNEITNDHYSVKEEASMRSSESHNDKIQSGEYQEPLESLPTTLNVERLPEYREWKISKSVPELPSDPMVSMPTDRLEITDDQHSHKDESNMRSSENNNEKLQLNEYQEQPEHLLMRLDEENNSENLKSQFSKSVPELPSDPMVSMPTDRIDITDDQHSHKEEGSMRSSENHYDKMLFGEYQEPQESLPTTLNVERRPEDRTWQFSKSVPELLSGPMVSIPTDKVDITADQYSLKEEASMRSSENQNEKLQINEYQEGFEHSPMRLDEENNSEDSKSEFSKSVPELPSDPMVSMPTDRIDVTDDQHSHKEEGSMRSSESQIDKMLFDEYQEPQESSPTTLNVERRPEDRTWQFSKSVSELPSDPMVSMPTDSIDVTDDQHSHKEEGSMRSSESQHDKMLFGEYQEPQESLPTTLNVERSPEDRSWQFSKSVPELLSGPMVSIPTDKVDITADQYSLKEEASMRSSENQNEKLQINEYQEGLEHSPMRLDGENNSEDSKSEFSKSVPELPSDPMVSMPTDRIDVTDDQHSHKKEDSMRSSESQIDKMLFGEYQEPQESLPTTLNVERRPEDRTWQFSKSVPELPSDSMVLMPTDRVDITDDQHSHKEESNMRSSENNNEKLQLNEYQERPEHLLMRLDEENNSENLKSQFSKSVPELPSDPMVSMPTDRIDITDDQHSHKEEGSMRSSENQNDKMLYGEYQEPQESLPTTLNVERRPEDRPWQLSKSVPELPSHPTVSMPTDRIDVTDDQHSHKEEGSMRSSESQNDKMLFGEYQEPQESLPTTLNVERRPEDRTWQFSKSVPELPSDPMVSMPTDRLEITDDQHSHKDESNMRSSENNNEKLQLNEYQERPEHLLMRLDEENNSENLKSQFSKSVPELPSDPMVSMPTDRIDITDDQHSHKEEGSMRSSESQNDKMLFGEYQEPQESLPTTLNVERRPEDRTWQFSKSVPELLSGPMVSIPTDKVDITADQYSLKEEASMRSSENQNEKLQINEYQEGLEHSPMRLDEENNSEDSKSEFSKSVPELPSDPMVSMPTESIDVTDDQHSHKEEGSMRSSESQNDEMLFGEYQEPQESLPTTLNVERRPEDRTWQFSKSVPELLSGPMVSLPTDKVDITADQYSLKEEASMRSSENQNEKLQINEYQEGLEHSPMRLDEENNSEDSKSEFSKSVPELPSDPMVSMPTDRIDVTDDQHSHKEEDSMRSSESQIDKMLFGEYQEPQESLPTTLNVERRPEDRTWQFSKSVPELPSDSMVLMPTDRVDITDDQHSHKEQGSMRSSESQNEEKQLDESQQLPEFLTKLVSKQRPEDRIGSFSKSVSEMPSEVMATVLTDNVDITNNQQSHKEEESTRVSQTQNQKLQLNVYQQGREPLMTKIDIENRQEERTPQFDQNKKSRFNEYGLHEPMRTKLVIEDHPALGASQFLNSAPELYKTPSDRNYIDNDKIFKEAKLSQYQNERQQVNFNHHFYDPLSSRLDVEKNFGDDSSQVFKSVQGLDWDRVLPLVANKGRFSYEQNPIKEQTNMRLLQNENENKEIQYPRMSLDSSNGHMNRDSTADHVKDFMHLSVEQKQRLQEIRDPILRSNERQYLSHKFNSLQDYQMLPKTSQLQFNNGQNTPNEHTNMRINLQQSRVPESIENHNLYNPFSTRWNTENQNHEPSPKNLKTISDIDRTLFKSKEFDNDQFISHDLSKAGNPHEYRTRSQLFNDHVMDDTQSNHWLQTNQQNDHFANYYKTIPEVHEEYLNPHLHRVTLNHRFNDADTFSHNFPSNRARLHDHMQKYHQEKSSSIDSSMEPSMHLNMREPFAKSGTEINNMHFSHPHGSARFGAALPIAAANPGAVGVFPTANAGGCGIPLLLSCSPSVVSGSLARSQIGGPIFKSVDDNYKYYIKRNAENIVDEPVIKVQKTSLHHNHDTGAISES